MNFFLPFGSFLRAASWFHRVGEAKAWPLCLAAVEIPAAENRVLRRRGPGVGSQKAQKFMFVLYCGDYGSVSTLNSGFILRRMLLLPSSPTLRVFVSSISLGRCRSGRVAVQPSNKEPVPESCHCAAV